MPRSPTTAADRRSRRIAWTIAALALLTGVLGALAALAPVTADDPVVSWPQAGQQPTSTVLPLTPYRPLQFDATVPCSTLGALDARGGGEALRTLPADPDSTPTEGLVVAVEAGTVTVAASGSELHSEPLPAGDCVYRVVAGSSGITVDRDGAQLAAEPGLLPPQVAELSTAAQGLPESNGLAVELHTDARYESSPTPLKTALLVAHALSLTAVLALAWRHWRGRGPGLVRPRLSPADGVVVVVSLAWAVLGPIGIDDSWYLLMARNATESGYIGNYVSQLNVAENPFVAGQYPMQAWGMLGQSLFGAGWGLLWMRVLPVVYGLGTYALLRVLVSTVVSGDASRGSHRRSRVLRGVAWAVALGHLLWFLPYGVALRPEPLIVLCSAGVLVLAELARRRESIGALAAATVVAVLAVTASPTGLVAAAPLVFALPWLWRWLRAAGWPQRAGAVLLAGASASIVVLPAFADATLGNVAEVISVHRWYYRSHPWYEEYLHYAKILEDADPGAWGKRLPVLLTLAVLLGAAIAAGRRAGTGGPTGRLLAMSAATTAVALLAVSLTPTKWVNHFGAVAAPAAVLLAAAALRSPIPRRAPTAAVTIGAFAVGLAAAVGYAGPNLWRPFGDWGQPFGDHTAIGTPYEISLTTPAFGPLELHNPLLWLAVAAAALWWGRRRRRRGLPSGPSPDRALLITAAGLGVVLMLAVFSYAPLRQYPGPSLALVNAQALAGSPCGLAGDVRVLTTAGGEPQPVTEVTAGKRVFADQASAALWPCVDQISIVHGIAEAPQLRLRTGGGLEGATKDNTARPGNGGTLAQVDRTVEWIELPSALSPAGVPIKPWGHVERASYDHPPGLVDLRLQQVRRWGWTELPTLARQDYAGRRYIG